MKKIFALLFTTFMVFSLQVPLSALDVSAQSAVLIEAQTGKILFAKNENEKRPMASTTKIMTTLLTIESGNLDEPFVVDATAIKVEGSSMGLKEGDVVTKRALCIGMLLPSGNDAANAAAIKLSGSYEAFAAKMNARAEKIGMLNTNFVTPSGLEGIGHLSTAYDMALLAREAMKNADFRAICSQKNAKLSFGNPPFDRWLKNSNKLLDMYSGCIGIKTGFTDEAGRCLVSAAERSGVTLICVTLKAPNDWNDHKTMLDYGFSQVSNTPLQIPDSIKKIDVVGGISDTLPISIQEHPFAGLSNADIDKVSLKIILPRFIYAPIEKNEKIGELQYFFEEKLFLTVPIKADLSVDMLVLEQKGTIFDRIKNFFK
ncbi:MAG: D-alanyl-D-alanine carboxypeptidase family protein [Oscillospiraceae bacterium]